jgi:L-iditol 2-dehydrogenase
MLALVKTGKGVEGVSVQDMPVPSPKSNEIQIKIHAAGICGTDLHMIHDLYDVTWPIIMGHEFSGTVAGIGADVKEFKKGDKVISMTAISYCGKCEYCYAGLHIFCREKKSIGSLKNGAFAEYMVVPAEKAFLIPQGIGMDEAALFEPLACSVRSVIEHTVIKAGDYVLITGPGSIGNLALQLARANGGIVFMAGMKKDEKRLMLAKEMGAKDIFYSDDPEIENKIALATAGSGIDVGLECSGAAQAAQLCLNAVKKSGRYTQVGLFGKKVELNYDTALYKGIKIWSGYASERTSWVRALRLVANGMINLKPLVSVKLPLSEWQKGMELAANQEAFKVLLIP